MQFAEGSPLAFGHQLEIKKVGQFDLYPCFHFFHVHLSAQLQVHGGYGFVLNAAGHYVAEVIQVGIHIKGKTMHSNPPTASNTVGADLSGFGRIFGIKPDAGKPIYSATLNAVMFQGANYGFLQKTQVFVYVGEELVQVKDGVTYDLSRTMVGNVSTAVDLVKGGVLLIERFIVEQQVVFRAAFPEGVNVWMFAEEQMVLGWCVVFFCRIAVIDLTLYSGFEKLLLQLPGLLVIDKAQISELDLLHAYTFASSPFK